MARSAISLVAEPHPARVLFEPDPADRHLGALPGAVSRRRRWARTRASQLADPERFGDVVVGAGIEPDDDVDLGARVR